MLRSKISSEKEQISVLQVYFWSSGRQHWKISWLVFSASQVNWINLRIEPGFLNDLPWISAVAVFNSNNAWLLLFFFNSVSFLKMNFIGWFVPNAPFFYPLKASENLTVFECFQGVEKGCIRNRWVKKYGKVVRIGFSNYFHIYFDING